MMENSRTEREKIIKDIRNLFRLKKKKKNKQLKAEYIEILETLLDQKNKIIKDITRRDIRNLFENEEEENYYKPVRVSNSWKNNYIEYKSNGDRNKTLSMEGYLDKIRPNIKDITNNLKKSDT